MTRKTQPPLQAFIEAIRKPLRAAVDRIMRRRKPDADRDHTDLPVIDAPAKAAPARTRTKPRKKRSKSALPAAVVKPAVPDCPHCRKPMVIKVARTGKNAGEFWGCEAYPKCRGIRPIFRTP
ncbi:topoisomerase [Pseudomonas syringae]|uniref:topoisomerase DNA-binding C4 zinc finger domain-containing protein n=1 Tax=Pseudomonas syringae TaxID=317 RepID=UPI001F1B2B40|nr:topoisomerase DNA-binding C4 zinc finger domain-containing protein [Pseudomonas syringae]MCF5707325.1 topoisomerase [Pseudomonas syringae]